MEEESRELTPGYMKGRIESLEFLLKIVVATLPEESRIFIDRRLREFAQNTEERARLKDTDPARDLRDAAHDTLEYFEAYVEDEAEGFADRASLHGLR